MQIYHVYAIINFHRKSISIMENIIIEFLIEKFQVEKEEAIKLLETGECTVEDYQLDIDSIEETIYQSSQFDEDDFKELFIALIKASVK